jgi:hypothetical protein
MSKARTSAAALAAFMDRKAKIDDLIARLQSASDDHFGASPDAIDWGHAGDLGYVTERLNEIAAFIRA